MNPLLLFAVCWIGFAISWLLAALWSAPATRQMPFSSALLYRALIGGGGILLNSRASAILHAPRLWHVGYDGADMLALLTIPGFLFAWWARLHLGPLWSGSITRKADHRVVDNGPYRFVRHPIYTGILFACLVSAIAGGTWVSMLGFGCIVAGFWVKARLEEVFLAAELDAGAYQAYRARTPMLVPFWPVRRSG